MASLRPMNLDVRVPLDSTTLTAQVNVRLTREYFVRMWLGIQLIRAAGWVLGANVHFEGITNREDAN